MRVNESVALVVVVVIAALCMASAASAEGQVEIGGKDSITGVGSVISTNPDVGEETTTLILGGSFNRTTESGRFEFGAGFTVAGLFADSDTAVFIPSLQGRINSNLLGAEENILVYAGVLAGVAIIDGDDFSDEVGTFGPKLGVEYYFSPKVAAQIEDTLLFDTEDGVTNSITLGIKFLF